MSVTHFIRHNRYYLLLLLLCSLCFLLPYSVQHSLEYLRPSIADGQLWRLITAHLLHTNSWHLLMNSAGLVLMLLLHGQYQHYLSLPVQFLASALFIGAGIYLFSADMQHYVGLSGVLHALLVWGACIDIQQKVRSGWLLLAGAIGKTGYEQWHGADPQLEALINANVAIDAHLYGVISGLLLGLVTIFKLYLKKRH